MQRLVRLLPCTVVVSLACLGQALATTLHAAPDGNDAWTGRW